MPILTKQFIDFKKEPLFFGSGRNVSRLDLNLQKQIVKIRDEQQGLIWFPSDFPLEQDVVDFVNLSEPLQQVFLANLKLQQLYDSVVARSIQEVFGPVTTNPQLESWWAYHTFTEAIHYQSYAEIIKALPVGEEVFDDIMINPKILKRAEVVADEWNKMVKMNAQMELNRNYNQEQHKIQLLKSLYALNILEAILFQSSFLVTWSFAENKKMIETANVISRIAWDEAMHCITSIYLLHQLKKDNDYTYLFKQIEQEVIEMYNQAYKADIEWIAIELSKIGKLDKVKKLFNESIQAIKLIEDDKNRSRALGWIISDLAKTDLREKDKVELFGKVIEAINTIRDRENLLEILEELHGILTEPEETTWLCTVGGQLRQEPIGSETRRY